MMLQKNEFGLSDFFGCLQLITMQLKKAIDEPGTKHTQLAQQLLLFLTQRKTKLVDNPLMITALYLDPRYKCEMESDENKVMLAKLTLENLWERVKFARGEVVEIVEVPVYNETDSMASYFDELDQHYDNGQSDDISNHSQPNSNRDKSLIGIALSKYERSIVQRMKSSTRLWPFWENSKDEFGLQLYELASIIHSIPPTQASVERNFSALKFMLTDLRYNLAENLLENLLLIHLNSDIYYSIKNERIAKLVAANKIDEIVS